MTYEEARDKYLRIGRNKRLDGEENSKSGKRKSIGKKGIGKLAGFGIADVIHIRTVAAELDANDQPTGRRLLTEFELNLDQIVKAPVVDTASKAGDAQKPGEDLLGNASEELASKKNNAPDAVREYSPVLTHVNDLVEEAAGTIITLKRLRPLDELDLEDFLSRLSRKFNVFNDDFKVVVAGFGGGEHQLSAFDIECQFRFPEKGAGVDGSGWLEAMVATPRIGVKTVRYWIGFTKTPIRQNSHRGIAVLAGGKQVQEPFEFKLAGGTTGQFGLQYLTGQVVADWLDEGAVDVIASDRASVRWSEPNAAALLKWGKDKLKELLADWIELRAKKTQDALETEAPDVFEQINAYRGPAKAELKRVVDRVSSTIAAVEESRRIDVIRSIVNAYGHQHVQDIFQRIINLPDDAGFDAFIRALQEWDIIDAVLTYQDLAVKAQALQVFDTLVKGGATEVKSKSGDLSLHEFLAENSWLLDPGFSSMVSETNLDEYLFKRFNVTVPQKSDKRTDFIAVHRDNEVKVIEIKSAKSAIDLRGVNNLSYYHGRTKKAVSQVYGAATRVTSLLIFNGEFADDEAENALNLMRPNPELEVKTWEYLLNANAMIYREMLSRVKAKSPNDPRIKALEAVAAQRSGKLVSGSAGVAPVAAVQQTATPGTTLQPTGGSQPAGATTA